MEPVVRAVVSGKHDQHRDAVGYVALMMAWMRDGMPESKFAPLMRKCAFEFYTGLKKLDTQTGKPLPNPDWMNDRQTGVA